MLALDVARAGVGKFFHYVDLIVECLNKSLLDFEVDWMSITCLFSMQKVLL